MDEKKRPYVVIGSVPHIKEGAPTDTMLQPQHFEMKTEGDIVYMTDDHFKSLNTQAQSHFAKMSDKEAVKIAIDKQRKDFVNAQMKLDAAKVALAAKETEKENAIDRYDGEIDQLQSQLDKAQETFNREKAESDRLNALVKPDAKSDARTEAKTDQKAPAKKAG